MVTTSKGPDDLTCRGFGAPLCTFCVRLRPDVDSCDAFDVRIPEVVLLGERHHLEPMRGDGGKTFVPLRSTLDELRKAVEVGLYPAEAIGEARLALMDEAQNEADRRGSPYSDRAVTRAVHDGVKAAASELNRETRAHDAASATTEDRD